MRLSLSELRRSAQGLVIQMSIYFAFKFDQTNIWPLSFKHLSLFGCKKGRGDPIPPDDKFREFEARVANSDHTGEQRFGSRRGVSLSQSNQLYSRFVPAILTSEP
jgi:hypothetical protein